VALAVVDDGDEHGLLLTRRSATLRVNPGQWALPGGRADAGETAVAAALRELMEELGVRCADEDVLGLLDDYATRSGYVITPVVVWCGRIAPPVPNAAEVASVHVVRFNQLDVEPRFVTIPESEAPVIQLPLFGDTCTHRQQRCLAPSSGRWPCAGRPTRVAPSSMRLLASADLSRSWGGGTGPLRGVGLPPG
jgi:8-oxo-dGTP pyrophosphatase MutT (NUDIX family)